jgi:hypothetical protein
MVLIGDDIQVNIIGMRGDLVRIGMVAPKSLPVNRQAPSKRPNRYFSSGRPVHTSNATLSLLRCGPAS